MLRLQKGLIMLSIGLIVSFGATSVYAQNLVIEPTGLVTDINKTANDVQKPPIDTVIKLKEDMKGLIEGANALGSVYDSATSAMDSMIAGGFSSLGDLLGKVGDGFSSIPGVATIKDNIQWFGKKALTIAKNLSCKIESAASYTANLFLGKKNTPDKLSGYDAMDVQKNVKAYMQEASRTMLADATQVMNGTSEYNAKNSEADKMNKIANKAKTVTQDITTVNEMNIATNVMTNILLSMDVTDLGIQSGLIYEELNNSKNTFLKLF